jgi:hypothetical protein
LYPYWLCGTNTVAESEQDGQRQTDQQHALRDSEGLFEFTEIRIGGVREENKCQSQLGESSQ